MLIAAALSSLARAAPVLDYQADVDCPDAGRFADEVSARLGLEAFAATGGETLTVRLVPAGGEVLGSLELGDGSRAVRGATCQAAFDDLVAAAAVVLDVRPAPAAAPEPAAPASGRATVEIETTQEHVQIARIVGRAVGTGSSAAGGTVTVQTTYFEDLCLAPCSFEIDPGRVELSAYGRGHRAVLEKFDLHTGDRVTLVAEPGSGAMAWGAYGLGTVGVLALVTGGSLIMADSLVKTDIIPGGVSWGLVGGGALAVGGAVPLWIASSGSFTREDPGQVVVGGRF